MRPPSVFVRDLLPEEGNRRKRLSRKAASEAKRERALICWASATKMSASQIAALVGTDETHVRKVVARRSTSGGLARWTLSSGAGVPAGSPPSSALGSSRWPVPVPTHSASPRRAGRCDVWRATCASSRSSRSRRRTWGESSRRPACRFSARRRGRPARIPTTRPRPRGCWRSTPPSPRTPSSSRSIRWARSACVRPPVRAGRHASCLNVNARPTPAHTARATSSVPTTCTPIASRPAAPTAPRQRQPRVPQADPRLLPAAPTDLLDPGQPQRELDPGHPRLRRRQQHRARTDTDLRQLPQPRRVSLPADQRVRRQERRLPQLGRLRLRARAPHHRPQRSAPRPTPHRPRTPPPDRRLTDAVSGENFRDGHY